MLLPHNMMMDYRVYGILSVGVDGGDGSTCAEANKRNVIHDKATFELERRKWEWKGEKGKQVQSNFMMCTTICGFQVLFIKSGYSKDKLEDRVPHKKNSWWKGTGWMIIFLKIETLTCMLVYDQIHSLNYGSG